MLLIFCTIVLGVLYSGSYVDFRKEYKSSPSNHSIDDLLCCYHAYITCIPGIRHLLPDGAATVMLLMIQ